MNIQWQDSLGQLLLQPCMEGEAAAHISIHYKIFTSPVMPSVQITRKYQTPVRMPSVQYHMVVDGQDTMF